MDIEKLRSICLAFPAATEDIKWENDLCFLVAGKMFCVTSLTPPHTISFKVPDEAFDEISNRDGFIPAPYMARAKWVQLKNPGQVHLVELQQFISQSYRLVVGRLSKKLSLESGI